MLERAIKDASDQATPPEMMLQLLSFVGCSLLALRRCAQQKIEAGLPRRRISVNNFTFDEAEYCHHFTVNAHLWGDILPAAVEREQLASFPWVEEELLAFFSLSTPTERFRAIEDSLLDVLHALAQNPNTPPPILKRLFHLSNLRVRRAATENPNVPILELFSEGHNTGIEPECILRNPAFPLLLVERPDFFRIIPSWLAGDFIRSHTCTIEILQELSEHVSIWVQRSIVAHPLVTPALLDKLSTSEDADVRSSVASHPKTEAATLLRMAKAGDTQAHRRVAKNPNTPDEGLRLLAQSADARTQEALAQNPKASGELLELLTKSKSLPLLRFILLHPNVLSRTLDSLAQDRRKALLILLAKHPKLSPKACELLAKNDAWQILRELKSNPATPGDLLEGLMAAPAKKKK